MKPFTYRKVTVTPERMTPPILVACNNGVNRYLGTVWRMTFPDQTWCRTGTKLQARQYINRVGHSHGVV